MIDIFWVLVAGSMIGAVAMAMIAADYVTDAKKEARIEGCHDARNEFTPRRVTDRMGATWVEIDGFWYCLHPFGDGLPYEDLQLVWGQLHEGGAA